jgi:hypothetical protein
MVPDLVAPYRDGIVEMKTADTDMPAGAMAPLLQRLVNSGQD